MNKPHKRCNAVQSEKGSENTAFMRQEIKFSKVLSKHIELVREELTHLGIEFNLTINNKIDGEVEKLPQNCTNKNIY